MAGFSQVAVPRAQVEEALRAVVGSAHVWAAGETTGDALFVEPANEKELSAVLSYANQNCLKVIPRGNGTKAGWGNLPERVDIILSTRRMNRILEHAWADLTVSVEAGCVMGDLQHLLAEHGQRLGIDPLWPEQTTVGGLISTNDSGSLRLRFGSVRDLIIGITLALPDGTIASSGGKVVKNVAGYDLPKLATGALGTLGVITRAVFRLHPLPRDRRTLKMRCNDIDEAQQLLLRIQDSTLVPTAVQLRLNSESSAPEIDVLLEGTTTGIDAQEQQLRNLASSASIELHSDQVWQTRQALWDTNGSAITKITLLSTEIAAAVQWLRKLCPAPFKWDLVAQAIGIATLSLSAPHPQALHSALAALRARLEQAGGSLVVLRRYQNLPAFDAWGTPGDSLPLMAAIKQQFDPNRILNPGRFLGGI